MASTLLRSGLRILDAGCGSGIITLALREALLTRGCSLGPIYCFDLTAAMLDQFRGSLEAQAIEGVELVQADVLRLDTLPGSWGDYDLIVSASMLEYVPRHEFISALNSLHSLLNKEWYIRQIHFVSYCASCLNFQAPEWRSLWSTAARRRTL